jgi:hypothetical protein
MRRFFDVLLLRMLVEQTSEERVVITVYITLKIDKYMKGVAP